jgi:hydrogenase maturation protein HypF
MGRLFDAVAALAGVCGRVSFEGQAAIALEGLAAAAPPDDDYPFELATDGEGLLVVDTRPLIAAVREDAARGVGAARIARRFHAAVVAMVAGVCGRLRAANGLGAVALSGGVFLNALLTAEVAARLEGDGFRVYRHHRVPPNDGGLCLGQMALAAARETKRPTRESC